ncbi:flavin reductase family protein [Streptomyces sp. NBC_00056]|uniref:flavin reductase family protein n=1 Tax=unclassified Streptomyces TaxID=2593676 RepID=UPI00224F0947|nr:MULTISPECIES: flavin reductase family protein [unclassified Streptomyces]MCX5440089.1 flavin reductase family protein [Streptomyces sp. NBC_00063]WSE17609.1 flavin reductase family protein [Streptomyces sp. NBC_01397]WUB93499.1 flavin reductase family protein [Streptomyces sp. NBC_00569]
MTAVTAGALLAEPDVAAFRAAMARFPTGVTLLTQGSGDETLVMTLNTLTSVSLDPLLILVSVKASGRMRPRISSSGSFAVNVLAESQLDLALEFCRPDRPEGRAAMLRLGAEEGVTGNAVLPAAETYVECVLDAEYTAGDHTLLIGRVVALSGGSSEPDPLLFHQGRFGRLSPASSASSVEQREAAA